jgi:hypothetical protein
MPLLPQTPRLLHGSERAPKSIWFWRRRLMTRHDPQPGRGDNPRSNSKPPSNSNKFSRRKTPSRASAPQSWFGAVRAGCCRASSSPPSPAAGFAACFASTLISGSRARSDGAISNARRANLSHQSAEYLQLMTLHPTHSLATTATLAENFVQSETAGQCRVSDRSRLHVSTAPSRGPGRKREAHREPSTGNWVIGKIARA